MKHLAALDKYYCKPCNFWSNLENKQNHLDSDDHNNWINSKKEYCEMCNVVVAKIARHNQSKLHIAKQK